MSAWFDCQSSADFRGVNGDGFCTRNSAVGLKGGFGNVFVGIWDTPFKRTIGNVGGRDTGIFGTAGPLAGNSTSTTDGASAGVFKRRQRNSINYDSPSFGGFQVMAAVSSTNSSTGVTATAANAKPRIF
jgi:predicted porin